MCLNPAGDATFLKQHFIALILTKTHHDCNTIEKDIKQQAFYPPMTLLKEIHVGRRLELVTFSCDVDPTCRVMGSTEIIKIKQSDG